MSDNLVTELPGATLCLTKFPTIYYQEHPGQKTEAQLR